MSVVKAGSKSIRTIWGFAATASLALTLLGAPVAAAAPDPASVLPEPVAPTLTTTVDGNHLTIHLVNPNTSLAHIATVCTAALINPAKGVALLPDLAAGTIPPLDQLDPAIFQWGPALNVMTRFVSQRTWEVEDVPAGVYVAIGVCTNPNVTKAAVDFKPVFVGSKIEVGSSVIQLGSAVVDTPGAVGAVLALLGIDTGSLGSAGGEGSSGSAGSSGSSGSNG
ncbi:hypothetical protein FK531_09535 [Rhodococcus spelaei]|uniref:Secreted protein n=1 Tax=Rhodococcus spelaei TaxID=2546320 RepID=A0A541B9L3_9NOCA|nr:hypothetical protein [Rhodococcus spelaei]TQF69017.1 hypothetical protein FK531_09535 [Rhodococcus spelaei]